MTILENTHYFLPPEWCPQQAVMLTWPHSDSDWAPKLDFVEPVFIEIARQIAAREALIIACFDEAHLRHIQEALSFINSPRIHFYVVASDDTWARDHGPITVIPRSAVCDEESPTKNKVLLDFIFNGWGNKFSANRDNQVSQKLYQQGAFGKVDFSSVDLVLEGGSIEVDGQGTLLTTKRCLLAKTRNPSLNQIEIETKLSHLLGVSRFLWLENGFLAGDDTDSHIDTLARFTDPNTICYVSCDDPKDEHYQALQKMHEELKNFKDYQGNPYRLVPLPWPSAKYHADGQRLPATYANFLIINGAVLVPTYRDPQDNEALKQIQVCFPDREIIGIDCLPLIEQGGSLHCVTMQLPLE